MISHDHGTTNVIYLSVYSVLIVTVIILLDALPYAQNGMTRVALMLTVHRDILMISSKVFISIDNMAAI